MAQNPAYRGVMYKHSKLTEEIIGAFFAVYNVLGYGFLEKVYANALKLELERHGLMVVWEFPVVVRHLRQKVGEYYADLIVNDLVIVEVKATKTLLQEHEAQLLNYLKATPYEAGRTKS